MLERLVLQNAVECISQRLQRTSRAQLMTMFVCFRVLLRKLSLGIVFGPYYFCVSPPPTPPFRHELYWQNKKRSPVYVFGTSIHSTLAL